VLENHGCIVELRAVDKNFIQHQCNISIFPSQLALDSRNLPLLQTVFGDSLHF
jgi:hypothetical protein